MSDQHDDGTGSRSFGIEEEFLLLDRRTGRPANRADEIVDELLDLGVEAEHEFIQCQLEVGTAVCRSAGEAEETLTRFRAAAARSAEDRGLVLAATGLPPVGGDEPTVITRAPRYLAIAEAMRQSSVQRYSSGLHVHVEVPSRDAGVDALARIEHRMPVLLALTANSPIWLGAATGFHSWRQTMNLHLPVAGRPPRFADGDAYTRAVEALIESGAVLDAGMITWDARLSHRFPTVEIRIADTQLSARDAVDFATLLRALVDDCVERFEAGEALPATPQHLVDAASWIAGRDGLKARLVDPLTGESEPAMRAAERLLHDLGPALRRAGDTDRIEAYLERRRALGSPAELQLAEFSGGGVAALLELFDATVA